MTARDVSRSEIKKEMEDGGLPGLEECQAGAGVGVDNPRGRGSDSRAAAAAVPGPEAYGRDNVRSVAQCGGAHGGWRADQAPKYSGKGSLEAFFMQFELAAELNGWPMDSGKKAARLVLSLTDDALACLTALGPVEQRDYGAVVGALQRRFGRCDNKSIVVTELCNRHRRPGESLRALATDVETLTRRAYGHMPPAVLSEYARDQFVRAIEPRDLRERVQLRHPSTLQEALELALEREELRGETTQGGMREVSPTVRVAVESSPAREQPEWVGAMMERMTELVRAVTLQPQGGAARSPGPMRCWGCGRAGHRLRDCRDRPEKQGNGRGSV
ncbi:hypothetical protein AAFF_G00051320 [Aldrovandia affinis]|uniref:CCHC-type domain-containing protein n=2 Tax=Aldrovandia affinis TaxID=143900 RepID=A0AAD7T5L5_9TELE|nr:hypothetical protein AAFF_G00051320 [Aldrovandia affinis]